MIFPLCLMSKWWTTLADGPRFLGPFYLQLVPSLGWSSFVPMGGDLTIQLISIDISWYQLISVDISWYQLISVDISWYQLISVDISWYQLISVDISSYQLISFHISWYRLISVDISWYQLISVDIHLKTMNQLRQKSRLQTLWALYKAEMTASPGFLCGSPITTDCSCCPCDMSLGHPPWEILLELQLENNRNAHVPWSKHCFLRLFCQ